MPGGQKMLQRRVKEFLVCACILWVREVCPVNETWGPDGNPGEGGISVTMRPATRSEVDDCQLQKGTSN